MTLQWHKGGEQLAQQVSPASQREPNGSPWRAVRDLLPL